MRSYSSKVKDEVRALRILGLSLNEIQRKMNIPRTTIRDWIADIALTEEQKEVFKERILQELQKGRIEAQKIQKEKRLVKENVLKKEALEEIGLLNKRDIFIAGIALYWGEGFKNKHEHRLGFCNSDPLMMKFYVRWLEICLQIKRIDLVARVTVNKSYEKQIDGIEEYWSDFLEIPITQFTKPFYQNSIWKKHFNEDNYKGVLRIHVKESLNSLLKMRGWIEGLKMLK